MLEKKPIIAEKGFLQNLRQLHPYQTMMYMAMAGSGFLFLVILVAYSVQRFQFQNAQLQITLPKAFYASTAFMLLSAACIKIAKNYILRDQLKPASNMLAGVFLLAMGFAGCQVWGWMEFYTKGFQLTGNNVASSYVYILSGIHLFHVALALGFLLYILIPFYRNSRHVVNELIFVTNPYQKKKMNMLFVFWTYVDVVWLVMFFYFALTF